MTIKFGFEVECEVNGNALEDTIPKGGWHSGRRLNGYWKSESDGSLSRYKWQMSGDNYELISKKLGVSALKKALVAFKKIFSDHNDGVLPELKRILYFNPSCGCHMHFSDTEIDLRSHIVGYDAEILFQLIMQNLKKEGFSEKFRKQFRNQYHRDNYAQKYQERNTRGQELNFTNTQHNTVEWRSFNLLPVETWDEFERILKVAVETIEQFVSRVKEKNFNYSTRVSYKPDKKEIIMLDKLRMNIPRLRNNPYTCGDEPYMIDEAGDHPMDSELSREELDIDDDTNSPNPDDVLDADTIATQRGER